MKEPKEGQRVPLGLKVTADVKAKIDAVAKASGRTQSQEAERLIERAFTYDSIMAAMNLTAEQMKKQNDEAAFRSAGYKHYWTTTRDGKTYKVWVEADFPIEKSGFRKVEE
jgi:protein-disulfide isomerase-like protein with CxxC motif